MVGGTALFAVGAIAGTIALVLALRPVSEWVGLVDRPDDRKRHETPTPAIGGLAMFLAIGSLTLILDTPPSPQTLGFDLAALVLIIAGVIDDRRGLRWRVRMGAQVLAALILIHVAGIRVESLGNVLGPPIEKLGPWSDLVTVIAVVGIINAVNMIDGVDGLAGSVSLASILMLMGLAFYAGNRALAEDLV